MRRRRVLRGIASLGTASLAGCTGGRIPGGTETPSSDPTATGGVRLAATDFTLRDQSCGQERDAADVTFRAADPAVRIDGTLWGSDTCVIAELEAARYDPDADRLTVTVVPARRDTTETTACGECIVEIEYGVTCTFEGGLPGSVEVIHGTGDRRTVVTTVER